MTTLGTFRMLRLNMINALCGIYLAAIAPHVFGGWWPSTRIPVLIRVAFFYVAGALAAALRALHRGKPTAVIRILELTPLIFLSATIMHFLGVAGAGFFGSEFRLSIDLILIPFWLIFSAALLDAVIDKDRLEKRSPLARKSYLTKRCSERLLVVRLTFQITKPFHLRSAARLR
jgi:hypothetical protein